MKTTLLIMAAGLGSRFGGGIKQLTPVGPNGEIIMDYSIHDAIEAGFNTIIFIIRKDIEDAFNEAIGNRIGAVCRKAGVEFDYCFQDMTDLPEGETVPEGRTKPWGTGQAVLAARDLIHQPFVVINADDYYGKEAFRRIHNYLVSMCQAEKAAPSPVPTYCMAGFILKHTLSENGGVTRGVCRVSPDNYLLSVSETKNIHKVTGEDGSVTAVIPDSGITIPADSFVSMNMWGLTPGFLETLKVGFKDFFRTDVPGNPMKAEYLLPILIGQLLEEGKLQVRVLPTNDTWFGVTYHQDAPLVIASFAELIEKGVYRSELFSDL